MLVGIEFESMMTNAVVIFYRLHKTQKRTFMALIIQKLVTFILIKAMSNSIIPMFALESKILHFPVRFEC